VKVARHGQVARPSRNDSEFAKETTFAPAARHLDALTLIRIDDLAPAGAAAGSALLQRLLRTGADRG
jgi:hypothetical protein